MSDEQKRGQLTQRVKDKSLELLGYEISLHELRLMPYTQYCMMNEQRTERAKLSQEEKEIFTKWEEQGFVIRYANFKLEVSKKLWDAINEILWLAYVDLH